MIVSSPAFGVTTLPEYNDLDAEIRALKNRITSLQIKIDELYRRPQMDYTDYAGTGMVLTYDVPVIDRTADLKPRWYTPGTPPDPEVSTTYQEFVYFTITGYRTEWTNENIVKEVYQPWKLLTSTSSVTIDSGTDFVSSFPTFNTRYGTTTFEVTGTGTTIETYHWETLGATDLLGWVKTNSTVDSTWNGSTPGPNPTTVTTGVTTFKLPTTIRYTPGTP
jgi:hypothetical protein